MSLTALRLFVCAFVLCTYCLWFGAAADTFESSSTNPESTDSVAGNCERISPDLAYVEEMLTHTSLIADGGRKAYDRRVALVIGNDSYQNAPQLGNPINDATAISQVLRAMGFTVFLGTDLRAAELTECVDRFLDELRTNPADTSVIFYAGHGMRILPNRDTEKRNYMQALDAKISDDGRLIGFHQIEAVLSEAKKSSARAIFFFDACRTKPIGKNDFALINGTSVSRQAFLVGMADELPIAESTIEQTDKFYSFATAPNQVADDQYEVDVPHSPYTSALLRHLPTPGYSLDRVMSEVSNQVGELTNWNQTPWTASSLTTQFNFNGKLTREDVQVLSSRQALDAARFRAAGRREDALFSALSGTLSQRQFGDRDPSQFAAAELLTTLGARNSKFIGHINSILAADISHDGKFVVTSARDFTLRLWDPRTGSVVKSIRTPATIYYGVTFDPSGEKILAYSDSGRVSVWEVPSGNMISSWVAHSESVPYAEFSRDGNFVATASFDGTAVVWEAITGVQNHKIPFSHDDAVLRVHFANSDTLLMTCSADGFVTLWDVETGAKLFSRTVSEGWVPVCAIGKDGRVAAAGSSNGSITVFDFEAEMTTRELDEGHSDWVELMVLDEDLNMLITASRDGYVFVWNLETGEKVHSREACLAYNCIPEALDWHSETQRIVAAISNNTTLVWAVSDGYDRGSRYSIPGWGTRVLPIAKFFPAGDAILTSSGGKTAHLFEIESTDKLVQAQFRHRCFTAETQAAIAYAYEPFSRYGDVIQSDLVTVDLITGEEVSRQMLSEELDFCWDKSWIIPGSEHLMLAAESDARDARLALWNVKNQTIEQLYPLMVDELKSVHFDSEARSFFTVTNQGLVSNYETGASLRTARVNFLSIGSHSATTVNKSGKALAAGYMNGKVRVFDTSGAEDPIEFDGHNLEISALEFSGHDRFLASGSEDTRAIIWNLETGKAQHLLRGHNNRVLAIEFDDFADMVFSASSEGEIFQWDVESGQRVIRMDFGDIRPKNLSYISTKKLLFAVNKGQVKSWTFPPNRDDLIQRGLSLLRPESRTILERDRLRYFEVN